MDKIWLLLLIPIVLIVLYFYAWSEVNNAADSARTSDELRVACLGLSVQVAPVRCLEMMNK